jgi:hypothetical protein
MSPKLRVAIVVPVYNESGVVEQSHAKICVVVNHLPYQFTFYYIDDGSNGMWLFQWMAMDNIHRR